MPSLRRYTSLAMVALGFGGWLGCSAAPGDGAEEGTASAAEKVGQIAQASTTCSTSLGCCWGTSLLWDMTNPLQAQLSAWGCTKPKLYQPNTAIANAWWFWSQCADPNKRIETYLTAHPVYKAAPYSTTVTTTLNPVCVPAPPYGTVDVLWDPTCATCKPK